MQKIIEIIISLIRFEICDIELEERIKRAITPELLSDLFNISQKHTLVHLIGSALQKNNLLADDLEMANVFKQCQLLAFYRYVKQDHELKQAILALESAGIPFIPLKGSVIRQFYSEPYMRTACDIDILVHEEDLDSAIASLESKLNYICKGKASHDVTLLSPSGEHIELHYDLIETGIANLSKDVLRDVWKEATPKQGYEFYLEMSNEMFYFYHIAHMAKHFINGGCGVRPFVDLWLINKNMSFDNEKKTDLLKKGGILTFAETAEKLVNVWFSDEAYTDVVKKMENYIFSGGIYGNLENQVAMSQAKTDSKLKSVWSKIFLDYDTIKFHYPILQKHKWLLPVMEMRRWCKLIFKKEHRKRSVNHLNVNQNLSVDMKTQAKELREYLGI